MIRWLCLVVLVVALSFAPRPAAATDPDEYRASLEAAAVALASDDPAPEHALALLGGIETITLDDGTVVRVDLSAITTALGAEPPEIEAAQSGIAAILAELEVSGRGSGASGAAARAALEDILAREEFQPDPEDGSPSLWERIARAINSIVESILEWIDARAGSGGGASPVSYLLAALGLLVIAAVVVFAVRGVRRSFSPRVVTLDGSAAEEHYTSAQARAEAERLFAAGEYRAALRMLYLATLIRWEEAGRLRFDRSLTNREVVARVTLQGDATLLEQLSPLVDRFDRVWYGGASCTSDDYAAFASLARRAWEAA